MKIIIIIMTSTLICLLFTCIIYIYIPVLSFDWFVYHFYLCILRVYDIYARHMLLHVYICYKTIVFNCIFMFLILCQKLRDKQVYIYMYFAFIEISTCSRKYFLAPFQWSNISIRQFVWNNSSQDIIKYLVIRYIHSQQEKWRVSK